MEENCYEAPLLEDVPLNTYDFSLLETDEETGYKSYTDEENGITARFGIDVSEFQGEEIDWQQVLTTPTPSSTTRASTPTESTCSFS